MAKKTVLLDLAELNNPTCGFGQIEANYARIYSEMQDEDLRFNFLYTKGFDADFGANVDYSHRLKKHSGEGLPSVNLWHTTNQQQLKMSRGRCDKYVVTIHDLNYLTEKGWLSRLKHHFILQRAINRADAITCISGFVGQQIEHEFNMHGKPVRVIYNGVDDITRLAQSRPAFVTGRPFFFTIGQIRKKKNFHLLADLMQHFPDYDLYIAGDDHFDWADEVRRRIARLHPQNAFLVGKISQEEKSWLYAHCDAFLFPSQGEGFGLPVIEAMQFGRAVYVSNFTCLPEISAGHAFIWPDLDIQAMADVVRATLPTFYDDAGRIEAMRRHAATFSYEKHIAAYVALYKELLLK